MNNPASQNTYTEKFIARWKASGASERANYQLFLTELCELLGVEKPRPATDKVHEATYNFERPVDFNDGEGKITTNFIDLYKQHCFVLEAKQGSDKAVVTEAELLGAAKVKTKTGTATRDTRTWEREMKKAKEQALRYARSLPSSEGWPPFLVVVDVGFCIDLYSDFTRQGKTYLPFPDPVKYRIQLADLEKTEIQHQLRLLFTDPLELDTSKRAAKVTRELAERLAKLAALLEQSGHAAEKVAGFLMRCLFTMFAEDVQLLPEKSFTRLLQDYKNNLAILPQALQSLWASMDKGGFDPALKALIPQFNGFLFKEQEALPLTEAQLELLILASEANWADVEPAIFGTLLERALQPRERHKLGAHYTPRSYVERLVMPTIIEPLREEWEAARTASAILEENADETGALQEIEKFHKRLCSVKVLDPACGSGNFLYVTLEHLKRLEAEVTEYIAKFPRQLGLDMTGGYTVTPGQLLGLEINPRAAAIADVVLWIGYLQWHFKTHGHAKRLEDPILRQYGNIRLQDALLSYTEMIPRLNEEGEPITRWDGHTTKTHPVTGLEVPDETAQTTVYDYIDPKPANWPEADFIVGNPPFVGNKRMRVILGDGYTEALRNAYKNAVSDTSDFVMYWWYKAAQYLVSEKAKRFGFITTNSITQIFNRKIVDHFIGTGKPLSLIYAFSDHPWVDSSDGAAVRIAMTVASKGNRVGVLQSVVSEETSDGVEIKITIKGNEGQINSNLTIGANTSKAQILEANSKLASQGANPLGLGFRLNVTDIQKYGYDKQNLIEVIRPYAIGRDIVQKFEEKFVIDFTGLSEEEARDKYPSLYQHLLIYVKPERDLNRRETRKNNWWLFGENAPMFRSASVGISQFIATCRTAKYRIFTFLDSSFIPDAKIVAIALDDYFHLGVLTSNIHVCWAMATGGWLGVGNDSNYNHSDCFGKFPFPVTTVENENKIKVIAKKLDSHRKQRQVIHPTLTITDMYNVLEKLHSGETLNAKEQKINEQALVSILLQLHNELDVAVADAYGWPVNLTNEEILEKLVLLNKERANEEARGLIRWLRPEYQKPKSAQQTGLDVSTTEIDPLATTELVEWPKNLAEQAQAIQRIIQQYHHPVSATDINNHFKKPVKNIKATIAAREQVIGNLLETISTLGLLRKTEGGLFVR